MQQKNRLSKNWQFQEIIKKNDQIVTKYLVIYFMSNNKGIIRVGISVSKKFANAVERNKQKRQTRAALEELKDLWFESNKSLDVVLMLRKPYLDAAYEKKVRALKEVIEKLQ